MLEDVTSCQDGVLVWLKTFRTLNQCLMWRDLWRELGRPQIAWPENYMAPEGRVCNSCGGLKKEGREYFLYVF